MDKKSSYCTNVVIDPHNDGLLPDIGCVSYSVEQIDEWSELKWLSGCSSCVEVR